MLQIRHGRTLGAVAAFSALFSFSASAADIKTVFVIAMENHNWTQPAQVAGKIQQIYQNPNAPFINSLVNGTAFAIVNGEVVHISEQVSYASAYHSVLATPSGNNPHIHPSEPNYLWAEAGTNFGVLNDNDPFQSTRRHESEHRSALEQSPHSKRKDLEVVSGRHRSYAQRQWAHQRSSAAGPVDRTAIRYLRIVCQRSERL